MKKHVRTQNFKLAAINAEAEASVLGNVLSALESGDPMKITALKETPVLKSDRCQLYLKIFLINQRRIRNQINRST